MTIKGTFHGLIAISGWALFVYWWIRVLPQIDEKNALNAFTFIGATVLATVLLTLLWVRYNIGIFRRKGPRKNSALVKENRDKDFLGRRIEGAGQGPLKTARLVDISVEGEVKKYEVNEG